MSRARSAAAAASLALTAVGFATARGAWFAAALGLAAWFFAGLARGAPELRLDARRSLSDSFLEPSPETERFVEVEVEVRNLGERLDFLELGDRIPRGASLREGASSWRGSLDAGASVALRYTLGLGRGLHDFSFVDARAVEPFSALEASAALSCPGRIVAPPPLAGASRASFGAKAARAFSGLSRARRVGAGTDFAGTRQYGPGDSLRSLNWRAQALWGEEIVNVYEEERALDAGIVLDCRAQAYDRGELFEAAASAAASLAEYLLDGGHRVAFLGYGSTIEWTPPGSGRAQRLKTRIASAKACLGSHAAFERFDNVPVQLFPPGSLVLLVSPLLSEDVEPLRSLIALGYSVAVLRPALGAADEAPDGGGLGRLARRMVDTGAELTASRLLRAGVEVWSWDPRSPLWTARPLGAAAGAARAGRARMRAR